MNLYAEDCVIVANRIYLISKNLNIVYYIDLQTQEIVFVDSLPDLPICFERAGACVIEYNASLLFLPMNASGLNVYELSSRRWKNIEIETLEDAVWNKFFCGVVYENKVHMIGHSYPAIVVVDLKSTNSKIISMEIYASIKNGENELEDCYFRKDFAMVGEHLYATSCLSNQVLIYNLVTEQAQLRDIGEKGMRFSGIAYDGDVFWIAARRTLEFYSWDAKSGEFDIFTIKKTMEEDWYLGGVVFDGKNVIFAGMNGFDTYVINPFATNVMESLVVIKRSFSFIKNYDGIDYCMRTDGLLELRRISDFRSVIKCFDVNVNNEEVISFAYSIDKVLQETGALSLPTFLNGIV